LTWREADRFGWQRFRNRQIVKEMEVRKWQPTVINGDKKGGKNKGNRTI
jgi:hypothetical protein